MAEDHAGTQNYDENFYKMQKDDSYKSATLVLPAVRKFIRPKKVIDIGCGVGGWLFVWKEFFGAEIYGVDGDYVDRSQLFIPEKNFHPANLENKIKVNEKFDLVETLEVAEHLSPARADSFVEDLVKLGNVILFSAAIVGQIGTNHVNTQMQSYWAERFLNQGYVGIDCIRPQIWNNRNINVIYRQNTLVYVKSSELYHYPELQEYYLKHKENQILDAVHPEIWIGRLIGFQNFYNQVRAQLQNRGGGGAVGRRFFAFSKNLSRQKILAGFLF